MRPRIASLFARGVVESRMSLRNRPDWGLVVKNVRFDMSFVRNVVCSLGWIGIVEPSSVDYAACKHLDIEAGTLNLRSLKFLR